MGPGSVKVTITMPFNMRRIVDEAAAAMYQSRSNFIRMAIVMKLGAKSQYEIAVMKAPDVRSDKMLANMYDFPEEYYETIAGSRWNKSG